MENSRTRLRWLSLFFVLVLFAGCSRSAGVEPAQVAATVTIDSLPDGLGRGYPIASLAGETSSDAIALGDPAPNFRLTLDDGRSLTLHDLAGRPVLVNFWATWCGPCRLEMPEIVRAANATPDLVVLAVNVQEELEPIQAFAGDFQMSMPIARDQNGDIRSLYQVRGMPTTFFVNRQGAVQAIWPGVLTPDRLEEFLSQIL
jgi:thiol-disulfide isomerase/thioredoxin